jgi:type I restriction enzyme, S subunit
MTYELEPYAIYKDHGVPWLGEMPEHWAVLPGRALFEEVKERDRPDEQMLSVTITRGVIRQSTLLEGSSKKDSSNLDRSAYKLVCPRDIVYNKMRAWQGAIGASEFRGIVSPAYVVVRLRQDNDPRYFHYLFRTPQFAKEAERWSYGITSDMWSLRPEHFKMIYCSLPPRGEQAAIVRFLDYADRRIRRYIRTKQKLIGLLNEQRQAIIHRAVTRGLNHAARLKPSGVEWLGDVPERWTVVRLGRLVQLTTGFPFKSEGFSQNESDIRLLRGINIAPGRVRWETIVRWPIRERGDFSEYELAEGDIVLGMDRPVISGGVRVARIGPKDLPSLVLQRVARIRPWSELDADFALLVLGGKNFADYLAPIFTGISVPHVSPEQIGAFRIAQPSLQEQLQIVSWVKEATATLEGSMRRVDEEIRLLREYRTRLVADIVTGKLDVREAAAHLPEEPKEETSRAESELDTEENSDGEQEEEPVEEASV